MNAIQFLSSQVWIERLGWTLVHFLWQGVLLAALYAATLRWMIRSSSPNARYILGCCALAAMMAAPFVTLMRLSGVTPIAPHGSSRISAEVPPVTAVVASVPADSASEPSERFLPAVVVIWLAGAFAFWIRLIGSWAVAAGMRSTQVRPASTEWKQRFRKLGARMGMSHPVRLLVSALVQVPTVVGWIHPVVLMPIGALTGLPPEQVEALLIHELAHVRRHDYLVNIFQGVAEALLFYHPAVWWVSGHIRAEREMCCDDIAVSVSGDALTYARALAELESFRPAHLQAPANVAIGADGGSLANRIGRLLGQPRPDGRSSSGAGALMSAVFIAAAACVVFVVLFSTFTAEAQTTSALQARDNLNQGVRAFEEARYEAATAYFQQALTLDPRLTEAELNLANTYSARFIPGSQTEENRAFANKAIESFQDVLKKDPNKVAALGGLAAVYQGMNDFRKAHEFYLRAAQLEPLNPIPFCAVGSVDWYLAFNKMTPVGPEEKAVFIEEGLRDVDIAIALKPDYDEAMTFKNLLLREKAMMSPDSAGKNSLMAEADIWFSKALEARRSKPPKSAVPSGSFMWAPPPPPPPPPSRPGPR